MNVVCCSVIGVLRLKAPKRKIVEFASNENPDEVLTYETAFCRILVYKGDNLAEQY